MQRSVLASSLVFLAGCGSPPAVDSGTDVIPSDASIDSFDSATPADVFIDRPPPPPRRTLPPSPHTLADLVGVASNPGDFPLGGDAASTARRAFYFRKMHELGIHRVRRDFRWAEIEPVQGTFVFDDTDRLVTEARAANIDVLPTLLYGNLWASTVANHDEFYPPDDPATFANYAARTAEHFRDRLHDWEVWNEPNAGFRFWRPNLRGDARAYGALLLATARAIETVDPSARVSFGGTVFIPQLINSGLVFATQAFDANPGLATSLTAYAFHTYNVYAPRNGPESLAPSEVPLLDKIALTAGMTEHEGVPLGAPFWITEIGWPSTGDNNETLQAQWTVRAVLLCALGGVDAVYLYTMGDGPHPEAFPPEDSFGLVHFDANYGDGVDPADKPVFTALRTLFATLGTYRVEARETIPDHPDDAFVVRLTDGAHTAWAGWILEGAPTTLTFTPPSSASARSRVSMDGTRSPLANGEAVPLTTQPLYVIE